MNNQIGFIGMVVKAPLLLKGNHKPGIRSLALVIVITCFAVIPIPGQAQLSLSRIFTNNMVLQREEPLNIWGRANPDSEVKVFFAGNIRETKAAKDSAWSVTLPPMKATGLLQQLKVMSGRQIIELENILIGDVWLCIGQSNMEWPMQKEMHFSDEISTPLPTALRFYNPMYAGKNIYAAPFTDSVTAMLTPEHFFGPCNWQVCNGTSLPFMSAVAYYFGKSLHSNTGVPIGLINLSIGGAPLETFIDPQSLSNHPFFHNKTKGDWLLNPQLPVWVRERGMQNVGKKQGVPSGSSGKNHAFKPGFVYASGIEPILPFGIKGIICYQGESNAQEPERVKEYAALSELLVEDYRKKWGLPLPFYYVQLASIDSQQYKSTLWPSFRDEQRKMMGSISKSGMAVTSDIGHPSDIHPTNKRDVGIRLAKWALNKTYKLSTTPSGPLPVKAVFKNNSVILHFQYAAKGLMVQNKKVLKGFSLDGIHSVQAIIKGEKVVIPSIKAPEYVYYGWQPFSLGNLVNSAGLPASTFKLKVK